MKLFEKISVNTPQKFKNFLHYLESQFYVKIYKDPSSKLTVIGVTGTDGKTTTCTLVYEILKHAGYKVGLVTTISARIGDETIPTGFHVTTPSPKLLQKFLKDMVDQGLEYVVLETTSHGLDQYRIGGIKYSSGIFTNVTHEHLDYHKTYEAYLEAKSKLIELIKPGGYVVINHDDKSFKTLYEKAKALNVETFTYGFTNESDMFASDYKDTATETEFIVHYDGGRKSTKIEMHLPGEYNVYNALGAIKLTYRMGISMDNIKKALFNVHTLEGRWEIIQKKPFKVIVDFAHTPNGLEKMLQYAKQDNQEGRVIVVFGTAGKRDFDKRPMMGKVAGTLADYVVLTAEDPRGENIININRQIAMGLAEIDKHEKKDYIGIIDRREAIKHAIQIARPGDTVVITGKGHEKSMNIDGKTEIPWSDQMVVKEILNNKE